MGKKQIHVPGRYLTVLNNPAFDLVESYKLLRTNIMFSLPYKDGGCRTLLITSANPGDGKTTTCVNIAITLAQANNKVLLIDADMRKPTVHKYFDLESRVGLSNALSGMNSIEECLVGVEKIESLKVITSGLLPPNPSELLSSPKMRDLITSLEETFDFIVIDSPPINVVTDGLAISKLCDGVVVVTSQKTTKYPELGKAISALKFAEANVVGFVLNKSHKEGKRFGRNYTYSYKYKYKPSISEKTGTSEMKEFFPR